MKDQPTLFDSPPAAVSRASGDGFVAALAEFTWQGQPTVVTTGGETGREVPVLTNEFWTSRQRAAHSLHEVSYRACFKPQLPEFFITRLTEPGDVVYDPFAGRGTTLLEAALHGRIPAGCDVNPLSRVLAWPRLAPPRLEEIRTRLTSLALASHDVPEELLAFYHPETLSELCGLRTYLLAREAAGALDEVDDWIRMVTVNRLTGHSPGFLSVYTLPPNQAVTVRSQRRINERRNQTPPRRDLRRIVVAKSARLLADVDPATRDRLRRARDRGRFHVGSCTAPFWPEASVRLVVTSPPFLDVVDYATDNWLRGWFCGLDVAEVPIEAHARLEDWQRFVERACAQCARLVAPGGLVAFEVGEVRRGRVRLEDTVVPAGRAAGLAPLCVVINRQTFTKTANIWGVANNAAGTNSNRIVVFERPRA
jgi:hypothetical protein